LVELPQVRQWYAHAADRRRVIRQVQRWQSGGRTGAPLPHPLDDVLDVVAGFRPAALDRALHDFGGLLRQQLHHAHVVLDAAPGTVLLFQGRPQVGEQWRQVPPAEHIGVVQGRRLALQRLQVVLGIDGNP
jgi:hypothetical protein